MISSQVSSTDPSTSDLGAKGLGVGTDDLRLVDVRQLLLVVVHPLFAVNDLVLQLVVGVDDLGREAFDLGVCPLGERHAAEVAALAGQRVPVGDEVTLLLVGVQRLRHHVHQGIADAGRAAGGQNRLAVLVFRALQDQVGRLHRVLGRVVLRDLRTRRCRSCRPVSSRRLRPDRGASRPPPVFWFILRSPF